MRLSNTEVLQHTDRYLELVAGREMSTEEKQAFIAETVDSYERYYNRGFITYRKSVTQAGQFAALEWSGQGAILHDLLGREYIDCLGGYGIFSAGVNHPKIVKAVTDQLAAHGAQQPGAAGALARRAGARCSPRSRRATCRTRSSSTTAPTPSRARSSSPGSTPGGTPSSRRSAGSTASRWDRCR